MVREPNENQLEAIKYDNSKPLVIEAGPGAGKTFVLIERIKFLIKEKHINPKSLLVITFTNKAANELKERLNDDLEIGTDMVNNMQISTIHSFCYRILSEYGPSGINILADNLDTDSDDVYELMNLFIGKHMEELGFTYESFIDKSDIDEIIDKFEEYTTFEVNTPDLVSYIKYSHPISEEYLDLIEKIRIECGDNSFQFPYELVNNDKKLKQSWFNAKYLAIAKAYPIYIELLEKEGQVDYNFLQIEALNLLRDPIIVKEIGFKNILIDEFQDTDPIQMQIFEKLMPNADSFTIVGDDDQCIYRFRGANPEYFQDFPEKYDANVVTLQTNYRSTQDIVEFNEEFIKDKRPLNSKKQLKANRNKREDVYCIHNNDLIVQANNIATIIEHLKETDKIKQYGDVGILLRSVSGKVGEITTALSVRNIPYTLHEPDLLQKDEIKSILTLLWYVNGFNDPVETTSWERNWLNLSAFTNDNFNSTDMFHLSSDTRDILSILQNNYEQEVYDTEKLISEELTGEKSSSSNFAAVFDNNKEILEEIFKFVYKPEISLMSSEDFKKNGITNTYDLKFFSKLQDIKNRFWNPENPKKRLSILDLYYELLNINNYIEIKLKSNKSKDKEKLKNIALLTNTIYNYENMVDKYDLNGLFYYLENNLDKYPHAELEDAEGKEDEIVEAVQILTVHKSKGLEFPVVIVPSLRQKIFPGIYSPDCDQEDYFYNGKPNYYTPPKFLKYKEDNPELIEELYNLDENHVVYVAMTRAEDLLILSTIPLSKYDTSYGSEEYIPDFLNKLKNKTNIQTLNNSKLVNINKTESKEIELEDKVLNLFYTSFMDYNDCPHKYSLLYNYDFKVSDNEDITYGIVVHDALNRIHSKAKFYDIKEDEVWDVIKNVFESNSNIIMDNVKTKNTMNNIMEYWREYGSKYEIIGSEIPFKIRKDENELNKQINLIEKYWHEYGYNYQFDKDMPFKIRKNQYELSGKVDLIVKKEDGTIKVIDFKNTTSKKVLETPEYYAKQLYIYILALKDDPDYNEYLISEGEIIAIEDLTPIPVDLSKEKIEDTQNKLNDVASSIVDKEYQKIYKNCGRCQLKDIACKKRNNV